MKKQKEQGYVVLCKFDIQDMKSTVYQECSTLEDAYKFITKLGVQIYSQRNSGCSSEVIEFKNITASLKSIPFLKVYEHDPNDRLNYLKGTIDFTKGYKEYVLRICKENTKFYEELVRVSQIGEQIVKSQIQNTVHFVNSNERV